MTEVSPVSILKVDVFPAPLTPRRPKHLKKKNNKKPNTSVEHMARHKFHLRRLPIIFRPVFGNRLKGFLDEKKLVYPILILVNYNYEINKKGVLGFSLECLVSLGRRRQGKRAFEQ